MSPIVKRLIAVSLCDLSAFIDQMADWIVWKQVASHQ